MLNREGAVNRQRGSMVLMVIFVMILFGFLAASLVRFSVDQNTGAYENTESIRAELAARSAMELAMYALYPAGRYYGWNAEVADENGYKDCERIKNIDKNIDPDGFGKGSERKFVHFSDKFSLPADSGLEGCSFFLECRKGDAAGSGVYYLTAIGRCGRDSDFATQSLSGYAANGNWHGEGR